MSIPIIATKLFMPPLRASIVHRSSLIERLNAGLASGRILSLISAAAGFGKTTLVSAWLASCERPVAWLSLDKADNDPTRFLTYLVAALQTIATHMGSGVIDALQSPQPPAIESILTVLLNEITTIPDSFILVLDDYHVIDSPPVDHVLAFLLEHMPPHMHLVLATREDPNLPLARLRVRNQLTELRAADLQFSSPEAAAFLTQLMGLKLSAYDLATLETRTEGWIAGLQLAAISMQAHPNTSSFIASFTGSHHFVLDYLVEEVLQQQPDAIQSFLLRTAILERMCGPLCDALLLTPSASGQESLEYLEHTNLFIIPLDNERRWYRYHHLFGDLLRQRLGQSLTPEEIAGYHVRASQWYEDHGLMIEAFQHAALANDIDRAERLIEKRTMGLHFRSVALAVLSWLASLPEAVLDARPLLRLRSATTALMSGQTTGVEEKLQAAEKAFQALEPDEKTRDLLGQVACARATLALTRYEPDIMLMQAQRALEYLHPDNLTFLFTANWALAAASILKGDRSTAFRACLEGLAISKKSGNVFSTILATTHLGMLQHMENQLYLAAETYQQVLHLYGDHPQPSAADVYLGLARISYQWNDLDAAERYGQQSLEMARRFDGVIDRYIISEVFLACLQLARGDLVGAASMVAQTEQTARQKNFARRLPEIAATQILILLRQGDVLAASDLAQQYELPLSQARVLLAQDKPSAALPLLESLRQEMEARAWQDERLKVMVVQALALHAYGQKERAVQLLDDVLTLAEPGGFIRLFVDEGPPMAELLSIAAAQGISPNYANRLLAAFEVRTQDGGSLTEPASPVETLSPRELEVLRLIAQGFSNQEIGEQLFLALDTVKGHNRRIFEKLQVQRRTEAVARAHELGLL